MCVCSRSITRIRLTRVAAAGGRLPIAPPVGGGSMSPYTQQLANHRHFILAAMPLRPGTVLEAWPPAGYAGAHIGVTRLRSLANQRHVHESLLVLWTLSLKPKCSPPSCHRPSIPYGTPRATRSASTRPSCEPEMMKYDAVSRRSLKPNGHLTRPTLGRSALGHASPGVLTTPFAHETTCVPDI